MALKDLSLEAMVGISEPWLDPAGDRPTLDGHVELTGSVMTLERAHDGLLLTQKRAGLNAKLIKELGGEAGELDATHDRKARACHSLVNGLIDRADAPDVRDAWVEIRQALFPTGLAPSSWSYLSEAGNVKLTRARITPEIQRRLDAAVIDGESLATTVEAWLKAGEALGEVFTRQARLKNETDAQMVSAGEVLDARNYWIRAVNNFIEMLGLIGMDDEVQQRLLTPLREAEKAAAKPVKEPEGEPV